MVADVVARREALPTLVWVPGPACRERDATRGAEGARPRHTDHERAAQGHVPGHGRDVEERLPKEAEPELGERARGSQAPGAGVREAARERHRLRDGGEV